MAVILGTMGLTSCTMGVEGPYIQEVLKEAYTRSYGMAHGFYLT
jgi:hypothetical protein